VSNESPSSWRELQERAQRATEGTGTTAGEREIAKAIYEAAAVIARYLEHIEAAIQHHP